MFCSCHAALDDNDIGRTVAQSKILLQIGLCEGVACVMPCLCSGQVFACEQWRTLWHQDTQLFVDFVSGNSVRCIIRARVKLVCMEPTRGVQAVAAAHARVR